MNKRRAEATNTNWRARSSRRLLHWIYRKSRLFPLVPDATMWAVALAIPLSDQTGTLRWLVLPLLAACVHCLLGYGIGLYRRRWRVGSFEEVSTLGLVWLVAASAALALYLAIGPSASRSPSRVITGSALCLVGLLAIRGAWRLAWERGRRPDSTRCAKTVVIGAGDRGHQIIRSMLTDPDCEHYPVAVLDDDHRMRGRRVAGVQVEGDSSCLPGVVQATSATVILLAEARPSPELVRLSTEVARSANARLVTLPAAADLTVSTAAQAARPPDVDELLGRSPVEIDLEAVSGQLRDRRVLITGAGGSIGSELSRLVAQFEPAALYFVDRDESSLHALQLSLEGRALLDSDSLVVADIRDRGRMLELFETHRPEVVFHAAALKHLPLLEQHPLEGVKTNILGTKNVLDAAQQVQVSRFVNVSTDKAADPTSVLGSTKLAAERLTAIAGVDTGEVYVSVRFGNVLGSRGSVLPTFLEQLRRGEPLTVTHRDATRYFMTIPEAVRLVLQAGVIGKPAEVLVLDMGEPVKILDLAQELIRRIDPNSRVEITGLRPGEKLHESLMATDEIGVARVHPRIVHTAGRVDDPAVAIESMGPELVDFVRRQLSLPGRETGAPRESLVSL